MANALHALVTRFLTEANLRYQDEQIEARVTNLLCLYDLGSETPNPTGVTVNQVYPRVRTAMAAYYAKRPELTARAELPKNALAAEAAGLLLNALTRRRHYGREIREALWCSRLLMFGCLKLGVDQEGFPSLEAVDPRAVRIDATTDRLRPERARWMAVRHQRSLAMLRASGLYKEKDLDRIVDAHLKRKGTLPEDEATLSVLIWEHFVYDGEGQNKIVVTTQVAQVGAATLPDDELVWIREEPFTNAAGMPLRFLVFMPSARAWYPTSPVEPWLPQVREVNAYRNNKLAHADRAIRKMWVSEEVEETEREKLENREPMTWLVTPAGKSGDELFGEVPTGQLSTEIYQGENEAQDTITMIDGLGNPQLGTPQSRGSTSATRDAISEQYLRLRSSDNQEIFEEFLEDVYQGLLHLAQAHLKGEMWFQVTGMTAVKISRKDIQGQMDVILSFGSTLPRDRAQEKQEADELYGKFAQDPFIDPLWLRRYVLTKYGVRDLDHALKPAAPAQNTMDVLAGGGAPGAGEPALPENPAQAVQAVGAHTREATPLSQAASFRSLQ